MGLWASYFILAAYLHHRGAICLALLPNLIFAALLAVPLPDRLSRSRGWRVARQGLAFVAAGALLWSESWIPAPFRSARLMVETGGAISPAFALRVAGGMGSPLDALAILAIVVGAYYLARRITLAPLAFAAILSVPLLAGKAGAASGAVSEADVEGFFAAEAGRSIPFPERPRRDFDVVIVHVCSMSWDDLRASGLGESPFLKQLDLVFTGFNSASSYTNPSAIRLLRAGCGQPRHTGLYQDAAPGCYLLDALRRAGYRTWSAVDNDAPSYHFVDQVEALGHADPPLPMADLPVAQIDFDGTPIHEDSALLGRWLAARASAKERRAALYVDLTTLHGGAHRVDDPDWWRRDRRDLYREAAERLFANLEAFFSALRATGRTTMVVIVAEHGVPLRGTPFQPADIREIPLPSITNVPLGVKLIGPDLAPKPERQSKVAKPTSYLAMAHLLASALSAPALRPELLFSDEALAQLPETRMVAENEAALVLRAGDEVVWRGKDGLFLKVPPAAAGSTPGEAP